MCFSCCCRSSFTQGCRAGCAYRNALDQGCSTNPPQGSSWMEDFCISCLADWFRSQGTSEILMHTEVHTGLFSHLRSTGRIKSAFTCWHFALCQMYPFGLCPFVFRIVFFHFHQRSFVPYKEQGKRRMTWKNIVLATFLMKQLVTGV